jgi:PPK2 family polyphosphate:nucleotide phosphotransferase
MTNDVKRLERDIVRRYRVEGGKGFRLSSVDPGDTAGPALARQEARDVLRRGVERVAALQERLYAEDRRSLLLIFQAMDAAGKDGAIKHVMSGVNPQGVEVTSFKHPSAEELDHTFLWRCMKRLPERGRIGIFNRSYYEEVLIVRVHEGLLAAQRIPGVTAGKKTWAGRLDDIVAFERHLARNGTAIVKFFLNVSRAEQRKRFLARIDDPAKHWKFAAGDVAERRHWDAYMRAYEEALAATSTAEAPWYVVPADKKWVSRAVVATVLAGTIQALGLEWPDVGAEQRRQIEAARRELEAE